MPDLTLTYHLPDDRDDANAAQHGMELMSLLQELDNELRSLVKYTDADKIDKAELERLRMLINEGCADAGINLW